MEYNNDFYEFELLIKTSKLMSAGKICNDGGKQKEVNVLTKRTTLIRKHMFCNESVRSDDLFKSRVMIKHFLLLKEEKEKNSSYFFVILKLVFVLNKGDH